MKVGDRVRVTGFDYESGSIGKIISGKDEDGDYLVLTRDSDGTPHEFAHYVNEKNLEPVNDFKAGDKVRIIGNEHYNHLFAINSIAEIRSGPTKNGLFITYGKNARGQMTYQWVHPQDLEPVEDDVLTKEVFDDICHVMPGKWVSLEEFSARDKVIYSGKSWIIDQMEKMGVKPQYMPEITAMIDWPTNQPEKRKEEIKIENLSGSFHIEKVDNGYIVNIKAEGFEEERVCEGSIKIATGEVETALDSIITKIQEEEKKEEKRAKLLAGLKELEE